jgi:5-methyltetrahydropteroyltriglutamate--homocysteine methyltransferase
VASLAAAGADFVQLDEPVLTELAFSPGNTRTFMCAALAARKDPAAELALAVSLINRVVEGMPVRIGVHVCRGNWSRDESTLLRGSYAALASHLEQIDAPQLVLEYATARAGDLLPFGSKEIGLGVVNPRTETVETPEEIRAAVARARALYPDDRIFLNPDCGFGTFSHRPMNSEAIALAKLRSMVSAARTLRQGC